jgi:hypothetical protein
MRNIRLGLSTKMKTNIVSSTHKNSENSSIGFSPQMRTKAAGTKLVKTSPKNEDKSW